MGGSVAHQSDKLGRENFKILNLHVLCRPTMSIPHFIFQRLELCLATMATLFGKRKRRRTEADSDTVAQTALEPEQASTESDCHVAAWKETEPLPPWCSLEDLGYVQCISVC